MKKRSLFLLLVLVMSLLLTTAIAQENTAALPAVNDKIGGFVVKSVTPMEVLGATGILFEHEKNGALLLYLASEDPNMSFDISFRTPALDDTGKAHVFEHISICGSEKYPDPNLFFPFSKQTYNTYVNAGTYTSMTTYPLSSLSEEQLMSMTDYYLAGMFRPLLYSEPRMVDREAWRYELKDAQAPITIAGTVYSEMQGALTTSLLAASNSVTTMFQNGLTAHLCGGLPQYIRTLTYDELVAFHDEYYHPSNALIVLYGKMDYEKFISYIDTEYISHFDRKDIYIERGEVEPYAQTAYATYEAPVENGAQTQNVSIIDYSFACTGLSMRDSLNMDMLASVLNSEASPIMRLVKERLPHIAMSCAVSCDTPAPMITFTANAANEGDRDAFVKAVDDGIAEIMGKGISQEDLDAPISSAKLKLMLTAEDSNLGISASQIIANYWACFGSTDFYNVYQQVVNEITLADLMGLMQKNLVDNTYRGVTVTKPVAGLAEENAAKLAEELAQKKAAMSEAEIQAMVQKSADFAAWSGAPANMDIVSRFLNMSIDKLPEALPEFDIQDEAAEGVRYLTTVTDVSDVAAIAMHLDVSAISPEKIKDVNTYIALLGYIGTDKHSREELETLLARYLPEHSFQLSAQESYSEDVPDPYTFAISATNLTENAQKGFELIEEMLFHTDLTQMTDIRSLLNQFLYGIRSSMDDPLSEQVTRCRAVTSDAYAFNNCLGGMTLYPYYQELIALAEDDPAALTARLESARELLLNGANAAVLCAGSADGVEAYTKEAKAFFKKLPQIQKEPVSYADEKLTMTSEALVNNSTVHINILMAPTAGYTGKNVPIGALIGDRYMMPQLRNKMGAYGAFSIFNRTEDLLSTYRDPNLTNTFAVFEALPEYLRTMELTQKDVDNYIVGSYGELLPSGGKLTQAMNALDHQRMGLSRETQLRWLQEAKATTVEDVRAMADRIEALLKNGVRSTSGAESIIEAHRELFDSVVKLETK
ncbi:MAG: insulinase family protein [Clostridia bacterium]